MPNTAKADYLAYIRRSMARSGFSTKHISDAEIAAKLAPIVNDWRSLVGLSDEEVCAVFARTLDYRATLAEVRRILSPDGWFCFDTPNRGITKIQSPGEYINPDHKYEYTHAEMTALLSAAGFEAISRA